MAKSAFSPDQVRCVAFVGHRSSGKTSLAEVLLQAARVTRGVGRVEEGTSLLDHEPEERSERASRGSSYAWLEWSDQMVQLVDTPGALAAAPVVEYALSAADSQVVVLSGPDGVEVGAERFLRRNAPTVAVMNKAERGMDLADTVRKLETITGAKVVQLQLPFEEDGELRGVIDLIGQTLYRYDTHAQNTFSPEPIPSELQPVVDRERERMMEAIALTDDQLLEAYFEFFELSEAQVFEGLGAAVRDRRILPLMFASAARCIGAHAILDTIVRVLPAASERALPPGVELGKKGFVVQWVGTRLDDENEPYRLLRVIAGAIPHNATWINGASNEKAKPRKLYRLRGRRRAKAPYLGAGAILATWEKLPGRPGDTFSHDGGVILPVPADPPRMVELEIRFRDATEFKRFTKVLPILRELDPTLSVSLKSEAATLAARTSQQLGWYVSAMRDRFELRFASFRPSVDYREMPRDAIESVQGLHRVMRNGEVAEYGDCVIDARPRSPGDGLSYAVRVHEDILPERFALHVGRGVTEALEKGPTGGFPVDAVHVECVGGDYDALESTEEHFVTAGKRAMREYLSTVGTDLLEPWSQVQVTVPADELGPMLSDIASHRGRVQGMEVNGSEAEIRVQCPDAELQTLADRLEAISGGRAWFTAKKSHYAVLPADLVSEVLRGRTMR